jgi:hypothetical protein
MKRALKQLAQDNLLFAMQIAFDRIADDEKELREVMSNQMERVERLFGYKPGSFGRGC